ncbi:MAG: hypothetical protein ACI9DF_003874 [Verrucomicrobiales bacterium]|jgi:hypothetical protein
MRIPQALVSLFSFNALLGVCSAVTFNVAGDWLADENGVQAIPNGSLIMLVASTKDAEFSSPSSAGFVAPGSDDVILGTIIAMDGNGNLNRGSYAATIQANFNDTANGLADFDAGDPVMLRWFPTLTKGSLEQMPSGPVPYGEFRSDETLLGSTTGWFTPGSNSAKISLSIVAASAGSRYNPKGGIAVNELSAKRVLEQAIFETTQAQLRISALANGALSLSWPLLEGADAMGRLQQSENLFDWSDVPTKIDLSTNGTATAVAQPNGKAIFYRIASE